MQVTNFLLFSFFSYKGDISMRAFASLNQRGQEARKTLKFRDNKHRFDHILV